MREIFGLRSFCVEEVDKRGGRAFFENNDWENALRYAAAQYKETHTLKDRFEKPEERDKALLDELLLCKNSIEKNCQARKSHNSVIHGTMQVNMRLRLHVKPDIW